MANIDYPFNFQNADSSGGGDPFPGDQISAEITGTANAQSTYQVISADYNGDNTYSVVVRQIKFGADGEAGTLQTTFTASSVTDNSCRTIVKTTPLQYTECNPNWDVEIV